MFGLLEFLEFFRPKKVDVLDHWIAFADNFSLSPTEFYSSVETELKALQMPGMKVTQEEFAEGGLLSDKRLYLRMLRERLVFDVCAAPSGTSFFFSCRLAEIPAVVRVWQLLVLVILLGGLGVMSLFMFFAMMRWVGLVLWPVTWIAALGLLIYIMRNAIAMGLQELDATLLQIPVINAVYEAWFRTETYYRYDTRLMYLDTVSRAVQRLAEEATAAKGVKLVRQYQQAPILGELYKPVKRSAV